MFSKTIVQSSRFLRMPASSRLLYYDLGMAADDDGYCEWYPVLQMTSSKEQDMQVLQANKLVIIYDTEVLLIKDWNENNQIRLDRYQKSKFKDKYGSIERLNSGKPNGNQMATNGIPSIGKVSIGKDTDTPTEKSNSSFEEFWKEYPKKVDRKKTGEKWNRLSQEVQQIILLDIPRRKLGRQWKAGFILNPMTYLNGERWNDEIEAVEIKNKVIHVHE